MDPSFQERAIPCARVARLTIRTTVLNVGLLLTLTMVTADVMKDLQAKEIGANYSVKI